MKTTTEVPKESDMWRWYRFAEKANEVNWNARYVPNKNFIRFMLPYLLKHTEDSVKKVTYEKDGHMRAVVNVSGGLDSCTSAWLIARAMQEGIRRKSSKRGRLVLLTFNGLSKEDFKYGKRFQRDLKREFSELDVECAESNLNPLMRSVHSLTDKVIKSTKGKKISPGSTLTRLVSLAGLEYADTTGHCAIDATNGSEIILGEIVLGAGCEYAPLSDLMKSQVFDLADVLSIPSYVSERNPVNSTYGIDKIHSYFGEIPKGLSARDVYAVLDPILFQIHELKRSPEKVAEKLGHSLQFVKNVDTRIHNQDHRRRVPYFAVNDHELKTSRTIKGKSNKYFEKYNGRCFLA